MATAGSRRELLLLFILQCLLSGAISYVMPDFGILESKVDGMEFDITKYIEDQAGYTEIAKEYSKAARDRRMQFEDVKGDELVAKMAKSLGDLLKKKMDALEESVKKAEELAMEYKWNADLKIGDVNYVNAKKINISDPAFQFNKRFKQRVNMNTSSVHIPVEIYEGDVEILNGLSWTSGLDEVWKKNIKKDPSLLWQYFGSKTGIFRNYPANMWKNQGVDLYDVRRRPWYTQGASSPKDMLILIDTSGSTHGQALSLMKQAAKSLLETLGENDFVNVATFSETAQWLGCFKTFVQANYRHKNVLHRYIDGMKARGMASYSKGLEFAFQKFREFNQSAENGTGAMCNRIIMFLTDGGTEMPKDVFEEYNWPDKKIRIFSYAVGPTADPVSAARWIACSNRGYFARIPAMGAIRSTVQAYVPFIAAAMALANYQKDLFNAVYLDALGLGMMTTVTLPVYNRSADVSNQTILGVMGSDVTTDEMQSFSPWAQLGPNGYAFAINANGYIVFHPNLKAQEGWLEDPPNVDFLDIEFENEDKVELRKKMINNEVGSQPMTTMKVTKDEMHIDEVEKTFFYTGVPGSNFSLGLSIPSYNLKYVSKATFNGVPQGIDLLQTKDEAIQTGIIIAPWEYCRGVNRSVNQTDFQTKLFHVMSHDFKNSCEAGLAQHLFLDASVTKPATIYKNIPLDTETGITARFVSTNGGLTRVYPPSAVEEFYSVANNWKAGYYTRAMDVNRWIVSAPYSTGAVEMNFTAPRVMIARAVKIEEGAGYKPAVAGVLIEQKKLKELIEVKLKVCSEKTIVCYLLDDSGYIIFSNEPDEQREVGRFFGDLDPVLMRHLVTASVFKKQQEYDYQASCPVKKNVLSAGSRTVFVPALAEMLTLKWWTMKLSWAYLNINLYSWLFPPQQFQFAEAAEQETHQNRSCIKLITQYYLHSKKKKVPTATLR